MKDIKTQVCVREREISNRKHGRLFSRFEHTCSTSPPSNYEGFPLKSILQDHSMPQHLQQVHTRTLGLTSPSLVPARTTQHELTSSPRPHLYNALVGCPKVTGGQAIEKQSFKLKARWLDIRVSASRRIGSTPASQHQDALSLIHI